MSKTLGIFVMFALFALAAPAQGQVVAIGASNTDGWGVGRAAAWPAQLETRLHADGYPVTIRNAGISGETTVEMLARLDSDVPAGTRVVLFDSGGGLFNNWRTGVERGQGPRDIAAIKARLAAERITVIDVHTNLGMPPELLQADHLHLTPEGHARVAARLAPQVEAALGRK